MRLSCYTFKIGTTDLDKIRVDKNNIFFWRILARHFAGIFAEVLLDSTFVQPRCKTLFRDPLENILLQLHARKNGHTRLSGTFFSMSRGTLGGSLSQCQYMFFYLWVLSLEQSGALVLIRFPLRHQPTGQLVIRHTFGLHYHHTTPLLKRRDLQTQQRLDE